MNNCANSFAFISHSRSEPQDFLGSITFEEIFEKTGKSESDVIKIMRRTLKTKSFKLWRERVHSKSIKNRKRFEVSRKKLKMRKSDYFKD